VLSHQKSPLPASAQSSPLLPPDYAAQDARFARAFAILQQAIADRAFPGCALSIVHRGTLVALKGLGRFTYEAASPAVQADTIFDLASVSKAVATTPVAMLLYERGQLDLDSPVSSLLPEFAGDDPRRDQVTVRMLLAHSSGLPAYERLFERARTREELVHAAMTTPLAADPETRAEYSDIGFIILGELLARLADEPLDRFCQREIFGPLGMARTGYCPPAAWRPNIPPSVDDRDFRQRIVQGEVHDENASVMGGIAGHAGVFAPAGDVALFAHAMLNGGRPILHPETLALFTRRQSEPPGTSRALGWDTPSQPSQSGRHLSPTAFGHLGYTGTSLWIDPPNQIAVTLLTNRTWPDHSNQSIKQVRPNFYNAAVEALG
jgi:CubicO group peptidase (beta-lactamase class C family)